MDWPKIMGLGELRENKSFRDARQEILNHWHSSQAEAREYTRPQEPTFWERVRGFFGSTSGLIAENTYLRTSLLKAIQQAKDAGTIGLQLYADNERLEAENADLREQIGTPARYNEGRAFFKDSWERCGEENTRLRRENEKLNAAMDKMMKDWDNLVMNGERNEQAGIYKEG